jgi:rRNA maturation endonuclease Nob1
MEAWLHARVYRRECLRCPEVFYTTDPDADLCPDCAAQEKEPPP